MLMPGNMAANKADIAPSVKRCISRGRRVRLTFYFN
jgi:hypothetical protein